jgi:hypothetical protein
VPFPAADELRRGRSAEQSETDLIVDPDQERPESEGFRQPACHRLLKAAVTQ